MNPPPTTATEARRSPTSGGVSGGGRAVSAYKLGGSGSAGISRGHRPPFMEPAATC